jgi:hypothetical protein
MSKCIAKTKEGKPCKNTAQEGSGLCHTHRGTVNELALYCDLCEKLGGMKVSRKRLARSGSSSSSSSYHTAGSGRSSPERDVKRKASVASGVSQKKRKVAEIGIQTEHIVSRSPIRFVPPPPPPPPPPMPTDFGRQQPRLLVQKTQKKRSPVDPRRSVMTEALALIKSGVKLRPAAERNIPRRSPKGSLAGVLAGAMTARRTRIGSSSSSSSPKSSPKYSPKSSPKGVANRSK